MKFRDFPIGMFCRLPGSDAFDEQFVKINPVRTLIDGTILQTVLESGNITHDPVGIGQEIFNVLNRGTNCLGYISPDTEVEHEDVTGQSRRIASYLKAFQKPEPPSLEKIVARVFNLPEIEQPLSDAAKKELRSIGDNRRILQHAVRHKMSDFILLSRHVHDFVSMDFEGNNYFIDGGREYFRRSSNVTEEVFEDLCLYENDRFEDKVAKLCWGTRGKDNKQPLRFILLRKADTDHLQAILANVPQADLGPDRKKVIEFILDQRKTNPEYGKE
jgi:hypothetical protein